MTDIQQAIVVSMDEADPSQALGRIALFHEDGTPVDLESGGEGVAAGPTVDRVYYAIGSQYFDTDLGMPIWWSGDVTNWVNSAGEPVDPPV